MEKTEGSDWLRDIWKASVVVDERRSRVLKPNYPTNRELTPLRKAVTCL